MNTDSQTHEYRLTDTYDLIEGLYMNIRKTFTHLHLPGS